MSVQPLTCIYTDFVRPHLSHDIKIRSAVLPVPLLTRCWLWCTVVIWQLKNTDLTVCLLLMCFAVDRRLCGNVTEMLMWLQIICTQKRVCVCVCTHRALVWGCVCGVGGDLGGSQDFLAAFCPLPGLGLGHSLPWNHHGQQHGLHWHHQVL